MYRVRVVKDDDLPRAQQWAMVEQEGALILFVKQSAFGPQTVAEAWAAGRKLRRPRGVPEPLPAALRLA